MTSRKEFLTAAASVPLVAAAPPSPKPAATRIPAPSKRKISEAARALAAQMRAFDASLSDKQIEEIAAGIDGNLKIGARINPHGTALKNSDEPFCHPAS